MRAKDRLEFERLRFEILGVDAAAVGRARSFSARFPDNLPARTVVAPGCFLPGDLDGYWTASEAAIELKPDDLHALLNATRLALLDGGLVGARALREQVTEAPAYRDLGDGEIARA